MTTIKKIPLVLTLILSLGLLASSCGAEESDNSSSREIITAENYEEVRQNYLPVIPYSEPLSEAEKKVDEKLAAFKAAAQEIDFGTGAYGIIDRDDFGYMNSELYDFCTTLPKGGDLHVHDDTSIPVDTFMDIIRDSTMISLEKGECFLYAPNNPKLPQDALMLSDAFEQGLITEEALISILTLGEEDAEDGYWETFGNLFFTTKGLETDKDLWIRILEAGFRSCVEKGILLVEIRSIYRTDEVQNLDKSEDIRQAYYNVRKDYPDFTVRIIGTSGKNEEFPKEKTVAALNSVISMSRIMKDEFISDAPQDLIIGLDLVNEEDASKPLSNYVDYFLSDEVQNSGLKLFLHCGESLRTDNDSVIDAYLLGSARVGHAFNLYRFPELLKKYAENNIAIEVCPVSNYRLGYITDLRLHPALEYLRAGVPVVICSDDGTFLSEAPLVDDFFTAILCWDLSLGDIKALCRNSITYSGLSEEETDRLMKAWEAQWDLFIEQLSV